VSQNIPVAAMQMAEKEFQEPVRRSVTSIADHARHHHAAGKEWPVSDPSASGRIVSSKRI
jgi:hypothetical protein